MSVWFEGSSQIECNMQQVKDALDNYGEHYVGVISLMPAFRTAASISGSLNTFICTGSALWPRTSVPKGWLEHQLAITCITNRTHL